MRNALCLVIILLCGYLCLPLRAAAQNNHFNIAPVPAWVSPWHPDLQKQPNSKDISEGYYHLLYEEQIHVEKKSEYRHVIRQIVSEAGIQNGSQLSVEYEPGYEQLTFHTVLIRRDGKVINKLSAANFKFLQQEEDINAFIYRGTYTAHLILDDVRKGDQLEYAYTVTGRNPIFGDKYFHTFYLTSYDPILNYYKCLIADSSRHLHFKAFNNSPLLKRSLHGREAWYQYEGPVPLTKQPDNVPGWYADYPILQVSEYDQWHEVVKWAQQINTVKSIGPLLQARIQSLKAAAGGNPTVYMEKAIRFVQDDIRYMGIEMGENSHKPNAPDKVIQQRFGDCKDKSLLLCTLLKADGINADMAYANTEAKNELSGYLPSPEAFNHAIVHATLNGQGYWIDPTIAYQRGKLSTLATPDYGLSLIVDDTTKGLTAMHTRPQGEVSVHEIFTIPANNSSKGSLKVITDYSHYFADDMRDEFATTSLKKEEETFQNFYKKLYGNVKLKDSLVTQDSADVNRFRTIENYTLSDPWRKDSNDIGRKVFSFDGKLLTDNLLERVEADRKEPLYLKYPYKLHYVVTLNMPMPWDFSEEALHIQNPYYRIDFKPQVVDNVVTFTYDLETFSDNVPASYVKQYVKDVGQISSLCYLNLSINQEEGESLAAATDNALPVVAKSKPAGFVMNWLALGTALLFLFIFWWAARHYMRTFRGPLYTHSKDALDIGGWLFLLGIGIFIGPFIWVADIMDLPVFNYTNVLKSQGKNVFGNASIGELILMGQLVLHVFYFVYTILLGFMFFFRRETFRVTAIAYFGCMLVFNGLETILAINFKELPMAQNMSVPFTIALAACCTWVPYLVFSDRARETFQLPYNSGQ